MHRLSELIELLLVMQRGYSWTNSPHLLERLPEEDKETERLITFRHEKKNLQMGL